MDELINLVSKKTGLDKETSRLAVETVLGYVKDKLPAPIAGQLDNLIEGEGAQGGLDDLAGGLGGLFGNK